MKLEEEGERLIAVRTCSEHHDVVAPTRAGKCIRFHVGDVSVESGRTSTGVRGIRLADGDEVIGMSMLRHVDADADERAAYLRQANAERRAAGEEASSDEAPDPDTEVSTNIALSPERYEELRAK